MLKRWCTIKEIEVYLLCEILISKDTLQGQNKNCYEPLKYCQVFRELERIKLVIIISSVCSPFNCRREVRTQLSFPRVLREDGHKVGGPLPFP